VQPLSVCRVRSVIRYTRRRPLKGRARSQRARVTWRSLSLKYHHQTSILLSSWSPWASFAANSGRRHLRTLNCKWITFLYSLWSENAQTPNEGRVMAASYVAQSAVQAGKASEIAAERKSAKYTAVCHPANAIFLFRWLSSLLAHWRTTLIVLLQRLAEEWLLAQGIREKRRSCTNAYQWRFNATTPCVLQTLSLPIRRSHSGHYHLHRHHRRRHNNNNNRPNNKIGFV